MFDFAENFENGGIPTKKPGKNSEKREPGSEVPASSSVLIDALTATIESVGLDASDLTNEQIDQIAWHIQRIEIIRQKKFRRAVGIGGQPR